MSNRPPHGLSLVSWIAVVLATAVAAGVVTRTMRPALPWASAPVVHNESGLLQAGTPGGEHPAAHSLANDPFRAGRALPSEEVADAPPDSVLPVSVVAIRLLGTVVLPTGSFAVCQLTADVPRIVHVGERLGALTLIILEPGRAVFQAPRGARLDLSLVTPRS